MTDGVVADYRVVVPTITDTELRGRLNLPAFGTLGDRRAPDDALRTTAPHPAVLKAMAGRDLRRVLVHYHLVEDARRFARELPPTPRLPAKTAPELCPDLTTELFFAHGEHTPAQRAAIFADPTRGVVRCAQALGRALRLSVSGKIAGLIVPVHTPLGADPEGILGITIRGLVDELARSESTRAELRERAAQARAELAAALGTAPSSRAEDRARALLERLGATQGPAAA